MGFLSKIVGTHSEREVKRVIPIVNKIESMEPEMKNCQMRNSVGKRMSSRKDWQRARRWMIFSRRHMQL